MKKAIYWLAFSTTFLIMHHSFAQSRIDIGIKAGLSIPNLTSGDGDNPISSGYGSRLGPDAAIHVEFHISKQFSIQPQLEYSSQGGKKDGDQAFTVPPEMEALFPPGQAPQYLYANYTTFLIMHHSFAQSRIDIGIKAGLSIPNLTSGDGDNPISSGYGSRLGPDAAIHVEFHISKQFSIQPQLEYSSQGGKKDGDQAFTVPPEMEALFPPGQAPQYLYANYKSEAKFNYLMVPVLAKYRFPINARWNVYVAAGPFASFLLSAKNKTTGSSPVYLDKGHQQPLPGGAQSFDNTENIKDDLRGFNAGISGHVGVACSVGKGSVFIEGGGNYGFIDIQKDKMNGANKTGAAVVVVGYAFSL